VGFSFGLPRFSGSADMGAGRFVGDIDHMSAPAPARSLPVNGKPGGFQTFFKGRVRIFGPDSKDPARLQGGMA
jgi:hypothetical protein